MRYRSWILGGNLKLNILYLVLLVTAFAAIAMYEVPQMAKEHHWRDLTVFSVLLLSTFTLGVLMLMKVNVPNPLKLVEAVVRSLRQTSRNLLP
jgi:hypothetical protein